MRGKHKKHEENNIEPISIDEPMPDDAVMPMEEPAVIPGISPEQPAAAVQENPLAQELEEYKRRVADNLDRALRSQAELDNLRKRTARDIENAHKYALERFVAELLPVIDSMEMGITASANEGDMNSLREGMELTLKMLVAALDKFGVKIIDPGGEKFNPERHEAVTLRKEEGVEAGRVVAVMQKGYELNGRLVRPAMVIVSQ